MVLSAFGMVSYIVKEIRGSIEHEHFFAALALSLTLPDICGKAEYPSLEGKTRERYLKWYSTYVESFFKPSDPYGTDMPYPSGEVIYNLRNSILHQGTPGINSSKTREERCKIDEFVLTISTVYDTGISRISYGDGLIMDRMLEVNIVYLCKKLCDAAEAYYDDNKDKFNFFNYSLKDIRHTPDDC